MNIIRRIRSADYMSSDAENSPITTNGNKRSAFKERASAAQTPREKWSTKRRIGNLLQEMDDDMLDELVDNVTRFEGGPRIITRFHPQPTWLWRQWAGTVLTYTWAPAVSMMIIGALLVGCIELSGTRTWAYLEQPDPKSSVIRQLKGLSESWTYLLTMATFVNSFFLSQSYGFWLATKGNIRKVQGRLSDLSCLLATHAARSPETGRYTEEARRLLDDIARYVRLYRKTCNARAQEHSDRTACALLLRSHRMQRARRSSHVHPFACVRVCAAAMQICSSGPTKCDLPRPTGYKGASPCLGRIADWNGSVRAAASRRASTSY